MFKKFRKNEKGFTLAELLIVVAIIGVLVAISIPIFTGQLKKARLATNQANARAAYAMAVAATLDDKNTATTFTYTVDGAKLEATGTAVKGNTDIAAWGVGTQVGTVTLGDAVAKTWVISFTAGTDTADSSLAGISAAS